MKQIILLYLIILSFFYRANAQLTTAAEQVFYVKRIIEKYHISPKSIDDNFSKSLFNDFIEELDKNKIIFTKLQIEELKKLENTIDDDINFQKIIFLQKIIPLYKNQLIAVNKIIADLATQVQDFNIDEKYSEDKFFAENDAALKNRWRLILKHNILESVYEYAIKSNNKNKLTEKQWLAPQEISFRKKEATLLQAQIALKVNPVIGFEKQIVNDFCNSLAQVFDPHTNYFSAKDKSGFEDELSGGQKIIFGFSLNTNNNNEIIIDDLEPGSPAYKSGQLHINDVLLKITLSNNENINTTNVSLEEVFSFLENADDKITLTVKKNDGQIKTIILTQAKVASEDGLVQSFLLKENINLGYIALPDFYVGTDDFVNQGCAADVAKEIIKLKKENIQGLILDLRYNGGGSLQEAMDLAGIFINDGPLALTKNSYDKKITSLRDNNRGTIYDGPLVVLVNGYSASASEIFASMLYDYNRAFIVGNKTYGKFIGQIVLPLDSIGDLTTVLQKNEIPKFGFVKVTASQYNNLKGASLQAKGIVPHIQLPELYTLEQSEATLPHFITTNELKKDVTYQMFPLLNTAQLIENSKQRMQQNTKLKQAINDFKTAKQNSNNAVSLKMSNYIKQTTNYDVDTTLLPNLYTVNNTMYYNERIKVNEALNKNMDEFKKYLEQDFYIRETFAIFKNILNIK